MKSDMKILSLPLKLLAMAIGVALVIALSPQAKIGKFIDAILKPDNAIVLRWLAITSNDGMPVTVVDIDDRTFQAWDQPSVTPRRELFGLVDIIARRKPALVLVDVDITGSNDIAELDLTISALEKLQADKTGPLIVLMRRLWAGKTHAEVPSFGGPSGRAAGERLAQIERIVETSPRLIWASAVHGVDGDGLIRTWRLAEAACNSVGDVPVRGFLTPYVITAHLMNQPQQLRQPAVADLKRWARGFAAKICSSPGKPNSVLKEASLGKLVFRSSTLPLPFHYGTIPGETDGVRARNDRGDSVVGYLTRTAAEVLANEPAYIGSSPDFCASLVGGALPCAYAHDRIVLIGASHVDSRDLHYTPLGLMAGVNIIANGLIGAKSALGARPWFVEPPTLALGVFAIFSVLTMWKKYLASSFASMLLLAALCAGFVLISSLLGVDASRAYDTVVYVLAYYSMFLLVGWICAMIITYFRWKRTRGLRAPASAGALLTLAMALGSPDLVAAQSGPRTFAGMVDRIDRWDGQPGLAMIMRGTEPERRLILGEPVLQGDRIRAPNADTTIKIRRVRGFQEICSKNAAREACAATVQPDGGLLALPLDIWRSISALMQHYGTASTVSLATRSGDPPTFRIAGPRPQLLPVTDAPLIVSWNGGTSPFRVRLTAGSGQVLAEARTSEYVAQLISSLPVRGDARIDVTDAANRTATLALLAGGAAPAIPDFVNTAPEGEPRQFIHAVWLSRLEKGAYTFAALQLLEAVAESHPPSAAYRAALRLGDGPRY